MLKMSSDAPREFRTHKHQELLGEGTPSSRVVAKLEGKRVVFMGVEPSVLGATQIKKQTGNFVVQADAIVCGSMFAAVTAARAEYLYVNARRDELQMLTNYRLTGFSFDNFHELIYCPVESLRHRKRAGLFPGAPLPFGLTCGDEKKELDEIFLWGTANKNQGRSSGMPSGWYMQDGYAEGIIFGCDPTGIKTQPYVRTAMSWTNVGGLTEKILKYSDLSDKESRFEQCDCCGGFKFDGHCTVRMRPKVYWDPLRGIRTPVWSPECREVSLPGSIEKVHVTGGNFSVIYGFPKNFFECSTQQQLLETIQAQIIGIRNKQAVHPLEGFSRPFATIQVEEEIPFVLPVIHPKHKARKAKKKHY